MTYKPGSASSDPDLPPGGGLRGPDKQQDERRVQRSSDGHGDPVLPAPAATDNNVPGRQHTTPREAAQPGADLRGPTDADDEGMPEGLRRERTHPLNPTTGRASAAAGKDPAKD